MIVVFLLAAVAALVVYSFGSRFGFSTRTVIALLVFLIPSVSATLWVYMAGDKASPDALTVNQNSVKSTPTQKTNNYRIKDDG